MKWPWSRGKPSEREVVAFVEAMLLRIAQFVDRYDVLVPEITIKAYGVEARLSVKRV